MGARSIETKKTTGAHGASPVVLCSQLFHARALGQRPRITPRIAPCRPETRCLYRHRVLRFNLPARTTTAIQHRALPPVTAFSATALHVTAGCERGLAQALSHAGKHTRRTSPEARQGISQPRQYTLAATGLTRPRFPKDGRIRNDRVLHLPTSPKHLYNELLEPDSMLLRRNA
jgi:hypothetical protein